MTSDGPRQRLLLSATALMCERGVHATGLADLLAHSRTARGSIYQHFPGGKTELMEQATYAAGRTITAMLEQLLADRGAAGALDGMIDYWKRVLTASDYAMGCPILAAAQSGPTEPTVQAAAASVFGNWTDQLAAALGETGIDATTARSMASMAISAMEGAIAQSRSARTTEPLEDIRVALNRMVETAAQA